MPGSVSSDETYVSQEVCTSVIHEAKGTVRRAQTVRAGHRVDFDVFVFYKSNFGGLFVYKKCIKNLKDNNWGRVGLGGWGFKLLYSALCL